MGENNLVGESIFDPPNIVSIGYYEVQNSQIKLQNSHVCRS